jgi:hypothetical protein
MGGIWSAILLIIHYPSSSIIIHYPSSSINTHVPQNDFSHRPKKYKYDSIGFVDRALELTELKALIKDNKCKDGICFIQIFGRLN